MTSLRIPDMMLMTLVTLLPLASSLVIPDLHDEASVAEPDPMCPMVGLDCIFHDIERVYDSA